MNFAEIFAKTIAYLPGFIQEVEAINSAGTGDEKKAAVLAMLSAVLNQFDTVEGKHISDPVAFNAGLGTAVDGIVQCLNASIWSKK